MTSGRVEPNRPEPSGRTTAPPHVTILMATCNGARYLPEQLASFLTQSHRNWSLWVSDDGSTDATLAILTRFAQDHPDHPLTILNGPQRGAALNFLSLLCHPNGPEGYVALSDQDDVWLPGKLARALQWLEPIGQDHPAAYGARTHLADEALNVYGLSPLHRRPAGFQNAVVQNILGGNSTVLNPGAVALLRHAGIPEGIAFHDWWIYLLISGAGGTVLIDPEPVLIYRQHHANMLGTNAGMAAFARRFGQVFGRNYRHWQMGNIAALSRIAGQLSPLNRAKLLAYSQSCGRSGPGHALNLWKLGFRRQTALGTALILLAACVGRL